MPGSFRDTLNLLSKVTPRRAWNGLQVLGSYYYSKLSGRATHWGLPISIAFEPTTSCNLRAPNAPAACGRLPTDGHAQRGFFQAHPRRTERPAALFDVLLPGRTLLHPKFLEMVRYAASGKFTRLPPPTRITSPTTMPAKR
jgi:MoaA/NifB/PqqE/SkfB family radical SAM enzyme